MFLRELNILNYKNIREANLRFSDKLNCFIGLNGQGKTNILDAIYYLSFTKSAYNLIDSQNITHGEDLARLQGVYAMHNDNEEVSVSCGIKRGVKKQFRRGKKDYKRLIDHIGLIPLVMVSPQDSELVSEGGDERRRFMDGVISQYNRLYLEHLTQYNALLKQRNALLKQYEDTPASAVPTDLFEVIEVQLAEHATYIYKERQQFIGQFIPYFREVYATISGDKEQPALRYVSQLQERNLIETFARTRSRDLILGWSSQGVHKDELEMYLGDYPLKRVGSQGQQKTFLLAMKLGQALYLGQTMDNGNPILLLDDIFDKLDSERVEQIIRLTADNRFGQIFITDTDRQHLTSILQNQSVWSLSGNDNHGSNAAIFHVENGRI
ncbi:MAG TPA: DNA replication and repair protein RecF [Bacteroidales bacterium]|nr:DNA replication and repair protein RecF [Bacteroidales bacterium]